MTHSLLNGFGQGRFNPQPKPEKKDKKKPKPIAKNSKKRKEENKEYLTLREVFLIGKICPITGQKETQVHHKKGRIGKLLTDVRYFLGVSAEGHKWIEEHPEEAKKLGYSLNRLEK